MKTAAEEFLPKPDLTDTDSHPCLFEIIGAHKNLGAKLSLKPEGAEFTLSAWPQEEEILLPAGASFRVKSHIRRGKGQGYKGRKIVLEYLGEWKTSEDSCFTKLCSCFNPVDRTVASAEKRGIVRIVNIEQEHCGLESVLRPVGSRRRLPRKIVHAGKGKGKGKGKGLSWDWKTRDDGQADLADVAFTTFYNKKLQRQDRLKHELTVRHWRRIDDSGYEWVRKATRAVSEQLPMDDAIAAAMWVQLERARRAGDAEEDRILQTPTSHFPCLHAGLRNALRIVDGAEQGCVLYRAQPSLTTTEDKAYDEGQTVMWSDPGFSWTTEEAAKDNPTGLCDGKGPGVLFTITGVLENKGAFLGRLSPLLPAAVHCDELLLPDGFTFKVKARSQDAIGEPGLTRIELAYECEDLAADVELNEAGEVPRHSRVRVSPAAAFDEGSAAAAVEEADGLLPGAVGECEPQP